MGRPLTLLPGSGTIWKVRTLSPNRMARCAVLLTILSTHRNDARSVMGLCGSCMPLALAIAVLARYGSAVSGMGPPPSTHGASARCCIPSSSPSRLRNHRRRLWQLIPSCGETGSVASIDGSGSNSFASSVSTSEELNRPHRLSPRLLDRFPVPSEHTTDSRGTNAWLAMLCPLPRLPSRLPSSGYQTPLRKPLACRRAKTRPGQSG
jgi:hypothetical protein